MSETNTNAEWTRASWFKYYIHDLNESCRIELTGELREANLADLAGCWQTAKTTLKGRKLVIDVRGLKAADDAGSCWMRSMATEGAAFLPETFFPVDVFKPADAQAVQVKRHLLRRLNSLLRGLRVVGSGIS